MTASGPRLYPKLEASQSFGARTVDFPGLAPEQLEIGTTE